MAVKMIIFAVCVATTLAEYAAPAYPAHHAYAPEHSYAPAPYNFEYSVHDPHTYDVKSQSEYSDGHGNVKGSYSLLEADGSTRVVEYTADDHSGFNAQVKKIEGHNSGYKPAYSAPAVYSAHSAYSAPASYHYAPVSYHRAPSYSAPASYHHAPSYSAPASYHHAPSHSAPASYHYASSYNAPAVYASHSYSGPDYKPTAYKAY